MCLRPLFTYLCLSHPYRNFDPYERNKGRHIFVKKCVVESSLWLYSIYPKMERELLDSYLFQEYKRYIKCEQPRARVGLRSPCSFSRQYTITPPCMYIYVCVWEVQNVLKDIMSEAVFTKQETKDVTLIVSKKNFFCPENNYSKELPMNLSTSQT